LPVDITPPIITITHPINASIINVFDDIVNGTVTDESTIDRITLAINGVVVKTWSDIGTSSATFSQVVNYTAGANNTINVTAWDSIGNWNTSIIWVTVLNSSVAETVNITANVTTRVDLTNETDVMLEIVTGVNVTGDINITVGTNITDVNVTIPMTPEFGIAVDEVAVGKYIAINVSDVILENITWAMLRMYYTLVDLDTNGNGVVGDPEDIDPSTLKLYWYNVTGDQRWYPITIGKNYTLYGGPYVYDSGVNQTPFEAYLGNVWANVSRYSVYGIAGSVYGVSGVIYGIGGAPGGGGGAAPPTIKVTTSPGKAEITIPSISPGETATVEIPETENMYLTGLGINVNKKVSKVKLIISTLDSKPEGIEDVAGEAYHYKLIETENIEDEDIDNVTTGFKVEQSWMDDKNIEPETVSMNRYYNDSWDKLSTTKTGSDSNYTYYSAISPGSPTSRYPGRR
jgi:PGF-pre-PGF domain-containing protein